MSNLNNAILKEFYCELDGWINEGCPHHEVFDRRRALCSALLHWSRDKQHPWKVTGLLYDIQRCWFVMESTHNPQYPFGKSTCGEDPHKGNLYTNQKRLNFIRSMMRIL